jgi:2-polyprenyl-3-methyl-5-hydroxy-6-metoxy-1,4-benzoquinol methylase
MTCPSENIIASNEAPICYLCGARGEPLYTNMKDRLFNAPGTWNIKRCPQTNCGLAWLDPMPTREDIYKAYNSYFTHNTVELAANSPIKQTLTKVAATLKRNYWTLRFGYAQPHSRLSTLLGMAVFLFPIPRARLDLKVMGLRAQPGRRLLDVGCGNGKYLDLMRSLGWRVEGVEVDPVAVRQARAMEIEVRQGCLEDQDYPADSFDAIALRHVIEHVHDPLGLLKECRRILKPDGRLVICTPNFESYGRNKFHGFWLGLDPPRHLMLFGFQSFQDLAQKAGLKEIKLYSTPTMARSIYLASRSIERQGYCSLSSPGNARDRVNASLFAWWEWLLLLIKPQLGEELVYIGEKRDV